MKKLVFLISFMMIIAFTFIISACDEKRSGEEIDGNINNEQEIMPTDELPLIPIT